MKEVLISIKPEWCELIASGKKTVEVRKTRPAIEKVGDRFKCYIYMTKKLYRKGDGYFQGRCCGKVIGEFICDNIECFGVPYPAFQSELDKRILEESCLTYYQLHRYAYHDALYGWHISQLKVYDEPKGLNNFVTANQKFKFDDSKRMWKFTGMRKPPQSWCYVEEVV